MSGAGERMRERVSVWVRERSSVKEEEEMSVRGWSHAFTL